MATRENETYQRYLLILAGLAPRCLSIGESYPIADGLLRQTLIGLTAISRI